MENLRKLFTGEIKNWQEVGGNNLPVVILNRATGSGTRSTFEKWVMDGRETVQAQEQDSSGMVRQIVSDTPGAISYVAFSYVTDEVNTLNVDGIEPKDENVTANSWKIWAYEHMYTKGEPTGLTKEFLTFMLSSEIQREVVSSLGYISIDDMQVERDWEGNIISE